MVRRTLDEGCDIYWFSLVNYEHLFSWSWTLVFLRDGNFWAVLMWYFSSCDLILENYILQGDEANLFRSLGWVGGQHRNVLNSLTPEISTQKMQNPWNWGVGGNESVVHRNQFWFVNFNLTLHCVCHFSSVFLIFWYGEKLWSVYGTLSYYAYYILLLDKWAFASLDC